MNEQTQNVSAPSTDNKVCGSGACERTYKPEVDVVENQEAITIIADLPGAAADGVEVNFENGVLSLKAKVESRFQQNAKYLVREYKTGNYERSFEVSEHIDSEKIAADFQNGVLKVTLPKAASALPRKIAVTALPSGH
jgi:HSP20 family protein